MINLNNHTIIHSHLIWCGSVCKLEPLDINLAQVNMKILLTKPHQVIHIKDIMQRCPSLKFFKQTLTRIIIISFI